MFPIIKDELSKYLFNKNNFSPEEQDKINKFYKQERLLTKEVLSTALRRYLTRYLIREKDIETFLGGNKRNYIKYLLYIGDLWDNEINMKEETKKKELKLLENMNIPIGNIINLYDYIEGDNFINEEIEEIKEKENQNQIIENKSEDEKNNDSEKDKNEEEQDKEEQDKEEESEKSNNSYNSYVNSDND